MNTPRPGHRVHACIVVTIAAVHAVLVAMAWQPVASSKPPVAQRMSMRLLAIKPAGLTVAASVPVAVSAKPAAVKPSAKMAATSVAPRPPVSRPIAAAPPEARAVPTEPVIAVTAPIQGVAFAPPLIGFGPPPAHSDARRPVASAPQWQPMQAQQQAARAQIADALAREVTAWGAPLASAGECAFTAEPEPTLVCDDDALSASITPRETALAGLLRAWRSMEPRTQRLTIAVVDGRYLASWN